MSDDQTLRDLVIEALDWEPSVTAAHIGVSARDGVVTLTGHVQTLLEKHGAEAATRRVKGVLAVAEAIEVRLPFEFRRGDDDIAEAAVSRLGWNSALQGHPLGVTVENGWVTLTGEVEWRFQHDAAAQDIRALWGVVGVTNALRVTPRVDPGDVGDEIARALGRTWSDPRSIRVAADGGKVRLTGVVHSWSDRLLATEAAWAAPGVAAVENDLVIG